MSDARVDEVVLTRRQDFQIEARFPAVPGAPPLLLDEPAPLGGDAGPNAAMLLGAAVGNCLSASLLFCLKKAHVEVPGLRARVRVSVGRNDAGRFRITGIAVDIDPRLAAEDLARSERCQALFRDFCIVTESVQQGIPIEVTVAADAGVSA